VLEHTDVFFLNDEEARLFTGRVNVLQAAREIRRMGPSLVVVKRGEHGVLCLTSDGWFTLPAFPVEDVCDPTGAGDSFAGGALGYLASRGGALDEPNVRLALAHGTAVASHTVQRFGVDGLTELTEAAIRKRVFEVREVSRFELDT